GKSNGEVGQFVVRGNGRESKRWNGIRPQQIQFRQGELLKGITHLSDERSWSLIDAQGVDWERPAAGLDHAQSGGVQNQKVIIGAGDQKTCVRGGQKAGTKQRKLCEWESSRLQET